METSVIKDYTLLMNDFQPCNDIHYIHYCLEGGLKKKRVSSEEGRKDQDEGQLTSRQT